MAFRLDRPRNFRTRCVANSLEPPCKSWQDSPANGGGGASEAICISQVDDLVVQVNSQTGNDTNDGINQPVATLNRAFQVIRCTGYNNTCLVNIQVDMTISGMQNFDTGLKGLQQDGVVIQGQFTTLNTNNTVEGGTPDPTTGLFTVLSTGAFANLPTTRPYIHFTAGANPDVVGRELWINVDDNDNALLIDTLLTGGGIIMGGDTFDIRDLSTTITVDDASIVGGGHPIKLSHLIFRSTPGQVNPAPGNFLTFNGLPPVTLEAVRFRGNNDGVAISPLYVSGDSAFYGPYAYVNAPPNLDPTLAGTQNSIGAQLDGDGVDEGVTFNVNRPSYLYQSSSYDGAWIRVNNNTQLSAIGFYTNNSSGIDNLTGTLLLSSAQLVGVIAPNNGKRLINNSGEFAGFGILFDNTGSDSEAIFSTGSACACLGGRIINHTPMLFPPPPAVQVQNVSGTRWEGFNIDSINDNINSDCFVFVGCTNVRMTGSGTSMTVNTQIQNFNAVVLTRNSYLEASNVNFNGSSGFLSSTNSKALFNDCTFEQTTLPMGNASLNAFNIINSYLEIRSANPSITSSAKTSGGNWINATVGSFVNISNFNNTINASATDSPNSVIFLSNSNATINGLGGGTNFTGYGVDLANNSNVDGGGGATVAGGTGEVLLGGSGAVTWALITTPAVIDDRNDYIAGGMPQTINASAQN